MNWMTRWPGDHPVFVDRAEGARFWDVDGNGFIDLCLGDTGGMAGHAPKIAVDAIAEQAARGHHADAPDRGCRLGRRARWPGGSASPTGTSPSRATDANRFAIRWARAGHRSPEGRLPQLVLPRLRGRDRSRRSDPTARHSRARGTSASPSRSRRRRRVVEINDLEGLERALAHGDVAVVPVRAGPHEHRHRAARTPATTRRSANSARGIGTLLLIDETHTISAGPGGCTRAWGLEPDIVTIGKTLGAGIATRRVRVHRGALPALVYAHTDWKNADVGGVGRDARRATRSRSPRCGRPSARS